MCPRNRAQYGQRVSASTLRELCLTVEVRPIDGQEKVRAAVSPGNVRRPASANREESSDDDRTEPTRRPPEPTNATRPRSRGLQRRSASVHRPGLRPGRSDSFQVYADHNPAEVVLVVSGLNSGELRATWGPQWRTTSEPWQEWFEANAFMVFHNGSLPPTGKVRACRG
ncbi:hypothetical protein GCM10029992_47950 [Glycomyces albus]